MLVYDCSFTSLILNLQSRHTDCLSLGTGGGWGVQGGGFSGGFQQSSNGEGHPGGRGIDGGYGEEYGSGWGMSGNHNAYAYQGADRGGAYGYAGNAAQDGSRPSGREGFGYAAPGGYGNKSQGGSGGQQAGMKAPNQKVSECAQLFCEIALGRTILFAVNTCILARRPDFSHAKSLRLIFAAQVEVPEDQVTYGIHPICKTQRTCIFLSLHWCWHRCLFSPVSTIVVLWHSVREILCITM